MEQLLEKIAESAYNDEMEKIAIKGLFTKGGRFVDNFVKSVPKRFAKSNKALSRLPADIKAKNLSNVLGDFKGGAFTLGAGAGTLGTGGLAYRGLKK